MRLRMRMRLSEVVRLDWSLLGAGAGAGLR